MNKDYYAIIGPRGGLILSHKKNPDPEAKPVTPPFKGCQVVEITENEYSQILPYIKEKKRIFYENGLFVEKNNPQ
jgi:hypothetical protein